MTLTPAAFRSMLPAGAAGSRLLLQTLAAAAARPLREADMVSADGARINRLAIRMIAGHRARRDYEAGAGATYVILYREHLRATFRIVRALVELRQANVAFLRMPEVEQAAQRRALRLERLRRGLGGAR